MIVSRIDPDAMRARSGSHRVFSMRMVSAGLLAAVVLLLSNGGSAFVAEPDPSTRIELRSPGTTPDESWSIAVVGLSKQQIAACAAAELDDQQWTKLLTVQVSSAGQEDVPPLFGRYEAAGDALVFRPRYPLRAELDYRVRFRPSLLPGTAKSTTAAADLEQVLRIPGKRREPIQRVTNVYPSSSTIPENLLKFYIHFSGPMSRGEAYRRIRLVHASGTTVADPFLELQEELWDRSGTRFTLLFDPGRVKRGLKPNEDVGAPLVAGESYELVVDSSWKDAEGQQLIESYRKPFRVVQSDHGQPDPDKWQLSAPPAGSRQGLVVRFNEPLDEAMLHRALAVRDSRDRTVAGSITISDQERRWQLVPEQPWSAGDYQLVIGTALEDMAGNSVGRAFEVDLNQQPQDVTIPDFVTRPFRVARE